jgi:hypothetical protein
MSPCPPSVKKSYHPEVIPQCEAGHFEMSPYSFGHALRPLFLNRYYTFFGWLKNRALSADLSAPVCRLPGEA